MKVMLIGPIKHWWSCWDSPEHRRYVDWRDVLSKALVEGGHLVYRPHEAWKGPWDETAQAVNDMAIQTCDLLINMTPPNTPSIGTDDEILYAAQFPKPMTSMPPPPSVMFYYEKHAARLVAALPMTADQLMP